LKPANLFFFFFSFLHSTRHVGPARQPHSFADTWDPADPGRGTALTVDLVNID
jgi:hypothetical protein